MLERFRQFLRAPSAQRVRLTMTFLDRWRLTLTLVPALLLFAGMDVVAWQSLRHLDRSAALATDTALLETSLVRLEQALLAMETGERGYLLTREPAYLRPYAAAQRQVDPLLLAIATGAPESAADVRRLKDAIDVERRTLDASLALAETDPDAALAAFRRASRWRSLGDIRTVSARILATEQDLLARQREDVARSVRTSTALAASLSSLFVLLAIVAVMLARAEARARQVAARAGARAMSQLEQRVAERTRDLEHARAETELALAGLRAILNSTSEAILSADEDGHIVVANEAASQAFGFPPERLVGMPLALLFARHLRATQLERALHAAASGEAEQPAGLISAGVGVRAGGEEFPLEGRIAYLRVADRRLFTLVLNDLTEPRRVEAALRERETQQQRLLGLLPDAVFVNRDGVVTFANGPALRLFARTQEDVIGRSPFEFIDPQHHELVRSRIAFVLEQDRKAPLVDIDVVRPDGTRRIVQSTATRMDQDGRAQVVVLMRDVTEHREAQREVQRSHDRLRALVAAQDAWQEEERRRVSREIHDDLQQSLAAIRIDLAMLDAALAAGGATIPPEARDLMTSIDELTESTVLSTRRIVEGLRPRILDEGDLASAMQAEARAFTRRTGIACAVTSHLAEETHGASPDSITCLYRLFQEALNNVRKHAQATRVDVTLDRPETERWRLRVRDNGRGMAPDDAAKPQSFGLLGMRERVAAVGGRLAVVGMPGEGTWIEAVVPCHEVSAAAMNAPPAAGAG